MNSKTQRIDDQRGATLIEVLVSVLLMSLGLLSMAAMQVNAVQYSKTSEFRAVATLLANDLTDRMRANYGGGDMSGYILNSRYSRSKEHAKPRKLCNAAALCGRAEMAEYDLYQWRMNLSNLLPGGDAYVIPQPQNGESLQVDIWIGWQDPGGLASQDADSCPEGFSQTTVDHLRCMYFRVAL